MFNFILVTLPDKQKPAPSVMLLESRHFHKRKHFLMTYVYSELHFSQVAPQ